MARPLVLFVINSSLTEVLLRGVELFRQNYGDLLRVRAFSTSDIEEESITSVTVAESLKEADMVFLDIRGGGKSAALCARILPDTQQPVAVLLGGSPDIMALLRLGSFSMKAIFSKSSSSKPPSLATLQRLTKLVETCGSLLPFGKLKHARNWARMMQYWHQGGQENIKNLLAFAAREYLGLKLPKPPKPRKYPDLGIFDPLSGKTYETLEKYWQEEGLDPDKPSVGLLFYGGMHFSQSVVPAKAFARRLKAMGINTVPVFSTAQRNLEAIRTFFLNSSKKVNAVVYFQWFQLTTFADDSPKDGIELLKQLGVPIFTACPMYGREIEKWVQSDQGLSPIEVMTTIILPELDGMIEPLPSAGLVEVTEGILEGGIKKVVSIEDRVDRACRRIRNWIKLQKKPNHEKRIAFVIYDNPPGEDNLGSAAYLDTFASLGVLFKEMEKRGYIVKDLPRGESLHEFLVKRGLVNDSSWVEKEKAFKEGFHISRNEYVKLLEEIPPGQQVIDEWGSPPGDIMTLGDRILIPAVQFGNILLAVQPTRGFHSDPDKISHDKSLPPHHQYVAFYRWLERVWQADCIVHVGTHGTLEFLKGKETGISQYCFPEALIGDVVHLYFYHVVNASEATIAKRRTLGVLINYNSPSFTAAGLYDDYASLEDLINECIEARVLDPLRAERLEKRVLEKAEELHLKADNLPSLQEELSMMKRSIIPKGLHVIGNDIEEDDRIAFATFLLRYDREGLPSLHRLIAESKGYDYEVLLCPSRAKGEVNVPPGVLEIIEKEVEEMVRKAWHQSIFPSSEPARKAVEKALEAARKLEGRWEIENFFVALSGGYVEPSLGGDPLRNPDVLPTGRNSFQFDPRLVPSEEACLRGMEIAENTINHYKKIHGVYPESAGVILWGFETTKTRGETVGQILGYLGVRVVHNSNPYHKKIEVIPLKELGRPRIDCLVQICGFFRDMYPNVMDLLNRAFCLVSGLEEGEEENYVRKHTLQLKEKLQGKISDNLLEKVSAGRIFGPPPGEYGTRTTHLIETGAWKDEEEIARLYATTMGHLYGDNIHGERYTEAYREGLTRVDVVSQIRDSHEYEIMDLDHYYEFFGGLARTVQSVKGSPPEMLITDTTKEVVRTETVTEALNRGIRTRLLNPKWIDALLEHDYHGLQKIADRVENLIGFAATTHAVENWVWSAVVDRYIRDEKMFRRIVSNNRFAAEEILKRLLEAERRGYFKATEEEIKLLKDRYLELEEVIEEKMEE
ncbi:MAG: magnesium chelatase subunit H [Thermodesulforhabdaceae bacterium]